MMSMNKVKQADPTKTRTGKQRLGPLTVTQLQALLVKEPRPKNKCKIQNRIDILTRSPGESVPKSLAEPVVDSV